MVDKQQIEIELKDLIASCERMLRNLCGRCELEILLREQRPDLCVVACTGSTLRFELANSFASRERMHFYIIQQWLPAALFVTEANSKNSFRFSSYLWLDDTSHFPGIVFCKSNFLNQLAMPDPYFIRSQGYEEFRSLSFDYSSWSARKMLFFGVARPQAIEVLAGLIGVICHASSCVGLLVVFPPLYQWTLAFQKSSKSEIRTN